VTDLPQEPGRRQIWLRWSGTLLALVLLALLLHRQGWREIGSVLGNIPFWHLILALGLMFISRFTVALRWHVLLRAAAVPIPLRDTLRLTFGGLFASNYLPTTIGGDVFRLAGALRLKLDAAVSAASLVADRLVGMAGMAMALPFGIPALLPLQKLLFPTTATLPALAGILERIGLNSIQRRVVSFSRRIVQTLGYWLRQPHSLALALFWTWVHMLCLFTCIALFLGEMGESLSFWSIAGLWSMVYFVTLLPISVNGYGLQEIAMTLIFTQGGGISEQSSLAVALLIRLLTMIASLPGAFCLPSLLSGET